jgi:hypothetical protein
LPSPNRQLLLSVAGIVPQPAHFERLHVDSVQKPPPDGIARRSSPSAIGEEEQTIKEKCSTMPAEVDQSKQNTTTPVIFKVDDRHRVMYCGVRKVA